MDESLTERHRVIDDAPRGVKIFYSREIVEKLLTSIFLKFFFKKLLWFLIINQLFKFFTNSLILAQDERWRRALGMQVKGVRFIGQPADGWVTRKDLPFCGE